MANLHRHPRSFSMRLAELRSRFESMSPELELTVRDPDRGVEGFVVVWNTAISRGGPLSGVGKGGTRVARDLSLGQVKRLARAMALKNAAAGLPLGGAKSGLNLDPQDPDYEAKYRRFVALCAPVLYENGGVFGGFGYDIGGVPPLNALWACDQLGSGRSFTGKPVEMGGTNYDVEGIAGLGVAVAAQALMTLRGCDAAGARFAVQGAGAMGSAVIRYFSQFGGTLGVVSDPKLGGTWEIVSRPSEPLIEALSHRDFDRAVVLLGNEGRLSSEDPAQALYAEVDAVFPCALEDALDADNARLVRARFVCEGANNAISRQAFELFAERGVHAVPGIIANAGGIIAAFVELQSGMAGDCGDDIVSRAKDMVIQQLQVSVTRLAELTDEHGVDAGAAAEYMAYSNIFGLADSNA